MEYILKNKFIIKHLEYFHECPSIDLPGNRLPGRHFKSWSYNDNQVIMTFGWKDASLKVLRIKPRDAAREDEKILCRELTKSKFFTREPEFFYIKRDIAGYEAYGYGFRFYRNNFRNYYQDNRWNNMLMTSQSYVIKSGLTFYYFNACYYDGDGGDNRGMVNYIFDSITKKGIL